MVDKNPNRIRRMFGQIAPRYDRMNHLLSLQTDRYWRYRTVRLVPPRGTAPILDVCCGTGDLALAYRRRADRKAVVVGSDFCREMLRIARRRREQSDLAGIDFVEADTLRLPFPDDLFQIVSVAFGLRNVADTDGGLREMTRVCQPRGRVAVLEFSMPSWQPGRALYGWYFRHILPRLGQWLARNDQDAYHYLPDSVGQFPQGEALLERMRRAGLHDVRQYRFTMGVATLYTGRKGPP